jgi:hypothetical protein
MHWSFIIRRRNILTFNAAAISWQIVALLPSFRITSSPHFHYSVASGLEAISRRRDRTNVRGYWDYD